MIDRMSDDFGLARPSHLKSRSISAENPTGLPGQGARATQGTGEEQSRDLGQGWKVSPSIVLPAGSVTELAAINGSGIIQHIWAAVRPEWWRRLIIRFYWDGADEASIELPIGDLFGLGWDVFTLFSSRHVMTAPYCGLNSFWPMPFHKSARITIENIAQEDTFLYYYVDFGAGDIPEDSMYLHATWNRSNPVADGIHTLLDVEAQGKYVGTFLAVGVNHPGWWGEGEVKFFIDDDDEFPTIAGTGTEDYFGGAWNFELPEGGYTEYHGDRMGMHQVIKPDGLYQSQTRFGMFRWHLNDAVSFESSLRVTVQDLGWMPDGRYLVRKDDIASTAFWFATEPHASGTTGLTYENLLVGSRP
ncbi:glycoside hydrolase family 172 protein [Salinibacterium sp.]|uniref:glycoside hydrolase family 172 protein n=1 Tax=Salinibacterium sp. TaxID=1915057 RepID=UPI00286C9CBA|nr:glycoside hydrolase family 172 protein [Salinibacterium sp.]